THRPMPIRAACFSWSRCRSPAPTRSIESGSCSRRLRRPARMARANGLAAAALLVALLLWPGAAAADSDPVATALTLINQMRGEQGLTPLSLDRRVSLAATGHAHAMAEQDFFGHVGPDGLQIGERLTRVGYVWS